MFRFAALLTATLTIHTLMGAELFAQCSCAAPPSCSAPGYIAPNCGAPGTCGTCGVCSNGGCCGRGKYVNIDFSRTITVIKKNGFGGFGEAPPTNTMVVSSMPVLPVNVSAVPISFSAASTNNNTAELAAAVAAVLERSRNTAATAAPSSNTCSDPCGDIKQLQSDVNQLKEITVKLTLAVEKLAADK